MLCGGFSFTEGAVWVTGVSDGLPKAGRRRAVTPAA